MKMTDDVVCIQYKTDAAQDMRRMEKFANNLMPEYQANIIY